MKRRISGITGVGLALTLFLTMGIAGCVTKSEFNAYKAAIIEDGEEIERWANEAQDWMDALVVWLRQQHPDGEPPAPPDPDPCLTDCDWGGN
jgi:hypothetical protein